MLIAKNIYKRFNDGVEVEVIKGINLEIKKGEFITITGKSGSGKTTLLYLLSGLEKVSEGKVIFKGNDINKYNDKKLSSLRRTEFGFIYQFYNLVPSLKIRDNICLPIEIKRKVKKEEWDTIYNYVVALGIEDKLNLYPHQLSGGQQQRVAIIRALAINPSIIFADEPTGNLDYESGENVLEILREINRKLKKTIVLVTHDQTVSKKYNSRNITVVDGRIYE